MPTKIVAVEVQAEQAEYLRAHLPDEDLVLLEGGVQDCPAEQYADADILSVFVHSVVTRQTIDCMPNLRAIATRSTGYDHIDLQACNERHIPVMNVPSYGENTVAEHTFGLILTLSRKIHKAYLRTVAGDFSLNGLEGFDIKGKTLGVVGAGSIGLHVIRTAKGFGMKVLAFDVKPNRLISEVLDFAYVPLDELFRNSDIVTLHAPYSPKTHHMVNAESFKLFKRGALLINTARGGLVDTEALIEALDQGILAGAGLDVLEGEDLMEEEERVIRAPEAGDQLRMLVRQHILLRRPDVVVTPHIAFFSHEAEERILETTVSNIRSFLGGRAANVVNAP